MESDGPVSSEKGFCLPVSIDMTRRYTLCLVGDDDVMERFPATIRYLQIGLVDEPADILLVLPESGRAHSLIAGPTTLVTHSRRRWPLDVLTPRDVITALQPRIDALSRDRSFIVHALSIATAPLAARIADAFSGDFIVNVATSLVQHDSQAGRAMDRASKLIVPATAIRDALMRTPLASKSIELVRPGVAPLEAPAAFDGTSNLPTLVFSGPLTMAGGADVLIRAAARVIADHPKLLTFVIGRGPLEPELRRLATALKISSNVIFTGRLEQLRSALDSADVFCIPKRLPNFREEPIHAMAAGLTIVAAEGAFCDGFVDHVNSILIPSGDEVQLANQISRMLTNTEDARRLAKAAHQQAKALYPVSKMVESYVRIYQTLAYQRSTLSISSDSRVMSR